MESGERRKVGKGGPVDLPRVRHSKTLKTLREVKALFGEIRHLLEGSKSAGVNLKLKWLREA